MNTDEIVRDWMKARVKMTTCNWTKKKETKRMANYPFTKILTCVFTFMRKFAWEIITLNECCRVRRSW